MTPPFDLDGFLGDINTTPEPSNNNSKGFDLEGFTSDIKITSTPKLQSGELSSLGLRFLSRMTQNLNPLNIASGVAQTGVNTVASIASMSLDPLSGASEVIDPKEKEKLNSQFLTNTTLSSIGSMAGGALGTAVNPGVGTAIGAGLGGIAGDMLSFAVEDVLGISDDRDLVTRSADAISGELAGNAVSGLTTKGYSSGKSALGNLSQRLRNSGRSPKQLGYMFGSYGLAQTLGATSLTAGLVGLVGGKLGQIADSGPLNQLPNLRDITPEQYQVAMADAISANPAFKEQAQRILKEQGVDITSPEFLTTVKEAEAVKEAINGDFVASMGTAPGTSATSRGVFSRENLQTERDYATLFIEDDIGIRPDGTPFGSSLDKSDPGLRGKLQIELKEFADKVQSTKETYKLERSELLEQATNELGERAVIKASDLKIDGYLREQYQAEGNPRYELKASANRRSVSDLNNNFETIESVESVFHNYKNSYIGDDDGVPLTDIPRIISDIDQQLRVLGEYDKGSDGKRLTGDPSRDSKIEQQASALKTMRQRISEAVVSKLNEADPTGNASLAFQKAGHKVRSLINLEGDIQNNIASRLSAKANLNSPNKLNSPGGELNGGLSGAFINASGLGDYIGRVRESQLDIDHTYNLLQSVRDTSNKLTLDPRNVPLSTSARSRFNIPLGGQTLDLAGSATARMFTQGLKQQYAQEPEQEMFTSENVLNIQPQLPVQQTPVNLNQQPLIDLPEAPSYANGIPRDSRLFDNRASMMVMSKVKDRPEKTVVNGLLRKWEQVSKLGDPYKVSRIVADIAKIVPDAFENGQGVDNKLYHKDEQAEYMSMLKYAMQQGDIGSVFMAKQLRAFLNPNDSRILPLEPSIKRSLMLNKSQEALYEY